MLHHAARFAICFELQRGWGSLGGGEQRADRNLTYSGWRPLHLGDGSVSRMEVDDTRAEDQTYHSNDETVPFRRSPGQNFGHALSTKIPTSDLARRQNVGPNERSGNVISPCRG